MKNIQAVVLSLIFFLLSAIFPTSLFARSYLSNMVKAHKRGIANIVTGPLEIPIAIQDAHGEGTVGVNYFNAALEGSAKALLRTASGIWDIPAGFIPGFQRGITPEPETLF